MTSLRLFSILALLLALAAALARHGAAIAKTTGLAFSLGAYFPDHRALVAASAVCLVAGLLPLGGLSRRRHGLSLTSRGQFTRESFSTIRSRIREMAAARSPDIPLLIDYIIFQATEADASDIHLDPTREGFAVRFRVDGMLTDIAHIPAQHTQKIANRLKVLSNLVVYQGFLPQDGRLGTEVGKSARGAELRIAFMPTLHGERVVLRILGRTGGVRPLTDLGMDEDQLAVFRKHLAKPQGMIILTGPTGSGKTTTIYAALSAIQEATGGERSIATLEDPIELELPGVNQSQVDEKKAFTFQRGLRAVLRQDPDVLMVGEIRDPETARIAIQAGMTGHLIITTVHANSSSAAFSRLLEMGVAPYSVNTAITAVVAERLARRLCRTCRRPRKLSAREVEQLGLGPADADIDVFDAEGCSDCQGSGFKGRHAFFEILEVTELIRELVAEGASSGTIYARAREAGMRSLFDAGVEAMRHGDTSPAEVLRVVASDSA